MIIVISATFGQPTFMLTEGMGKNILNSFVNNSAPELVKLKLFAGIFNLCICKLSSVF